MSWLELAIVAFIILSIGYVVWKGGAANPIGTGRLQHDVRNIRQAMGPLGSRLSALEQTAASKKDVERMEERMREERSRLDQVFACLATIDKRQDAMAEQVASTAAQVATTARQVDRLYDVIVPKGMSA